VVHPRCTLSPYRVSDFQLITSIVAFDRICWPLFSSLSQYQVSCYATEPVFSVLQRIQQMLYTLRSCRLHEVKQAKLEDQLRVDLFVLFWNVDNFVHWLWRCLSTPSGIRSDSDRTQFMSDLASELGFKDPFSLQMDSSDPRSRITLEPINGSEPVFPETVAIFGS